MQRIDLARILFGDWRSAAEAHVANAVHLVAVLFALWVAREQGMAGPTFDFITLTAIATTVVFGIGRLARTPKPARSEG
ncbi:hypothetical protein [Phenylobacterium sp.]|jgi:uncharacterized membrane protein|uniref:hypothetical protein n=1 Tax=Phenylobacterium sp. TaxID=1871053 RepID=UPI002E35B5E6|nr:hypothetical protein [Phenylobacterium sp.]HEX2562074.1 hypothetical protein [Phenylobacterium sp.]